MHKLTLIPIPLHLARVTGLCNDVVSYSKVIQ